VNSRALLKRTLQFKHGHAVRQIFWNTVCSVRLKMAVCGDALPLAYKQAVGAADVKRDLNNPRFDSLKLRFQAFF
jgi:hypothetical protein